jgi:hypothetical protein
LNTRRLHGHPHISQAINAARLAPGERETRAGTLTICDTINAIGAFESALQAVDVVQVTEDDLSTFGRHPYPTAATPHHHAK